MATLIFLFLAALLVVSVVWVVRSQSVKRGRYESGGGADTDSGKSWGDHSHDGDGGGGDGGGGD